MSLVVLSSGQNRFEDDNNYKTFEAIKNRGSGISQPNSFLNALTAPIKIPPNSEVSVVSAKIHRNNELDIPSGMSFSWYIGEPLSNTGSLFQRVSSPFECYIEPGTYSFSSLPVALQASLREYIHHPDYWNSALVSLEAGGQGYVFQTLTQGDHAAVDLKAQMTTWTNASSRTVGASGAGTYTMTFPGTGPTLVRNLASAAGASRDWRNCSLIGENLPLSAVNGRASFDLTSGVGVARTFATATAGFTCGLTRPTNWYVPGDGETEGDGERNLRPPYSSGGGVVNQLGWYDYAVVGYRDTNTNLFTYRIVHAVSRRGFVVMAPLVYWSVAPVVAGLPEIQLTEQGLGANAVDSLGAAVAWNPAWTIDSFVFTMTGESIKIEVIPSGHTAYTLCDAALSQVTLGTAINLRDRTIKPVGDTCRALYPKMALRNQNDQIKLITWGGVGHLVNTQTYAYPQPPNRALGTPATTGSSWWGRLITAASRNELTAKGASIDVFRGAYQYSVAATAANTRQYLLTDTNGAAGTDAPNYSNIIILEPSPQEKDINDVGSYIATTGNVSSVFGFPGLTHVAQGNEGPLSMGMTADIASLAAPDAATGAPAAIIDNARGWWWIPSSNFPAFHVRSLFIKCPTLTQQSYNGATGSMSKILAHLPRFDNAGNEFGSLYFQVNDRVYLKLNNPNELTVQEFQIDLCGKSERLAGDLGESTEIVLHIR
jgi:hypothetical protein